MVRIEVKMGNNDETCFLYEAKAASSVDEVTRELATALNQRQQIRRLVAGVRQLIMYGPMKPENERGLSEDDIKSDDVKKNSDPTGLRIGEPVAPEYAKVLERTASEAEACVDTKRVQAGQITTQAEIKEVVQNIKGAVMIAFPMNLPEYDEVRMILEGKEDLKGKQASKEVLDPDTAILWFCGKQMMRDHTLSKYTGANDKCKVKVKITHKGSGAPQKEASIDEETRKKMMALYYKKQEEAKQLESDQDDAFLNSAWADPKAFKSAVSGVGNISFRY